MNNKKIKELLNKKYSAILYLAEFLLLLSIGLILIFNKNFFITTVNTIFLIIIFIYILIQLILFITQRNKSKKYYQHLFKLIACLFVLYITKFNPFLNIIPITISQYALIVGITYIITLIQYRHDYTISNLIDLFSAITNIIFGYIILTKFEFSLTFTGIYIIVYSISSLINFIDEITSNNNKNKLKRKFHISLPVILCALIPNTVLRIINKYFEPKKDTTIKSNKNKDVKPNIEILVHVTPNGNQAFGHVDMCIENTIISYGGYDYSNIKFSYTYGPGVMFEVKNKMKYIKFCQKTDNKSLFGFGIYLNENEMNLLKEKINSMKKNCYEWKCPYQKDKTINPENDYSSLLYYNTNCKFYKFKKVKFKYYFVAGVNCVKFVDELLRSCMDTVICGIISPGTYYDFLNKEFNKKNGIVITKTIYYHKKNN